MFKKTKYIAYFLDKVQSTYKIIKKKRFKLTDTKITFKKGTYLIDKGITGFSKGMKIIFFFDIKEGQLSFYENKSTIDPKLAHLVLVSGVIDNITSGLTKKTNFDYNTLIWIGIGALLGFFIGFSF